MANTILEWEDSNDGHLGYKLRKSGYPYMDPVTMDLVATVGPTDRTYTAPPGNEVQFWRVSAYNTEQDVPSDKLGLSFPIKIMTNDVLTTVMAALNSAGTGFGPYHPDGGSVGNWNTSGMSTPLIVTTAGGKTLAIDSSAVREVKLVAGVPTLTKLADQLANTSTIRWAVSLPNGKVVYGCPNLGYAVFDPSDNSVSLGLARASDIGNRGVYAADLGKIILAGTTGNPGTDKLRFLLLDPATWTIENVDVPGATGGQNVYDGLLVVGTGRAHYWPGGSAAFLATIEWAGSGGTYTPTVGTAPAYPSSYIANAQGLALVTGEFLAIGGGNAYLISASGVETQTLLTYLGGGAATFSDNVTVAMRTPDGGFLFMAGGAAKFLYYNNDKSVVTIAFMPSEGFQHSAMLDGRVFIFSSSQYIELTWVDDVAPPINFPNSYLASQYNCQGRNPMA